MTSPRSEAWQKVRDLEDVLALVTYVDDHRRVIRAHAWRQGDFGAIFREATAMDNDIQRLREALSELWQTWIGEAREDTEADRWRRWKPGKGAGQAHS